MKKRIVSILLAMFTVTGVLCMNAVSAGAVGEDVSAAFSDMNFKAAIRQTLGKNAGDPITAEDCAAVTELNIGGKGILLLTGIERFTNLERLDCSGNKLTNLALSGNTKLTWLDCSGNKLTSLSLSTNTALRYLNCSDNKLRTLNFSTLPNLRVLICKNNSMVNERRITGLNKSRLDVYEFLPQDYSRLEWVLDWLAYYVFFGWVTWISW